LKPSRPKRYQPTPEELRDKLLHFIQTHFYQSQPIVFAKDRPRLLKWVVLKLATYLDEKAVSISTARYQEIMQALLLDALRFGNTGNITYLPAWLGRCVDSHMAVHGEKYYEEGKANRESIQTHLAGAMNIAQAGAQGRDPIREMADAARLLKPKKRAFKAPKNQQPELL
jgi:hypothetical protein